PTATSVPPLRTHSLSRSSSALPSAPRLVSGTTRTSYRSRSIDESRSTGTASNGNPRVRSRKNQCAPYDVAYTPLPVITATLGSSTRYESSVPSSFPVVTQPVPVATT